MTDRAVLSVDVELFSQTPAYRAARGTTEEEGVGIEGLAFLQETLAESGAPATWFVVSSVAEQYPQAIAPLADGRHEIGSHTHDHRRLSALDADERHRAVHHSRAVLSDVTGADVRGFRAPVFDISPDLFELLGDAGYGYDASVAPTRRIPGFYTGEYSRRRPCMATAIDAAAPADLVELPVGVMPGLGLPLTGTWLRFFGPRYTLAGMKLLADEGIAPVLYVHPWELVDLPAVEGVPKRVYYHTGEWMRRALERILAADFEFVTAATIAAETREGPTVTVEREPGGRGGTETNDRDRTTSNRDKPADDTAGGRE